MTLRLPLFACLVLGVALTASGQKMITLNPVNIEGELVQAGPRSVIVKGGDGKNWTVTLGNSTKVKIAGTAVPEMLTPRVSVRFFASIDKKTCKAQDKLDKITIFTPTPGVASRTLGVELAKEGAKGDAGPEAGMGGPMIIPNMRQNPAQRQAKVKRSRLAKDQRPTPASPARAMIRRPAAKPKRGGRAGKGPAASVPEVASYEVCAQVVSYHGHRLIVNAPNHYIKSRITAELSPEAEIALDLSELSIAKPGDKVSAKGYYITPGICQHTDSLVITLANPLGEKAGRSHRAKPAAKANESPRRPAGKAKPEPAAPADQNPAAPDEKAAPEEKPAGDDPAEKPLANKERPKDDNDPVMDDPNAKPDPAPAPKPDETKPEEKKPDEKKPDDSAEKKSPPKNNEKDIFEK